VSKKFGEIKWLRKKIPFRKHLGRFHLPFLNHLEKPLRVFLVDEFAFSISQGKAGQKRMHLGSQTQALKNHRNDKSSSPKIRILLEKAYHLQQRLKSEPELTRANLAHELNVSRPRITQILKLLDMAPEIQNFIHSLPQHNGHCRLSERQLRPIMQLDSYRQQVKEFNQLVPPKFKIGC